MNKDLLFLPFYRLFRDILRKKSFNLKLVLLSKCLKINTSYKFSCLPFAVVLLDKQNANNLIQE